MKNRDHRSQIAPKLLGCQPHWARWFAGLLVFGAISLSSIVHAQEFKIIANSSVNDSQLSEQELRLLYLGKQKKWSNGRKVTLTYLHDSKTLDNFSRNLLSKTSFQFITFWKRMVFTGKGSMPKSFKNEADLIDYVRNTPGAIGFVSNTTDVKDVKTITITKNSGQ